jgi:hypothetical protein
LTSQNVSNKIQFLLQNFHLVAQTLQKWWP